MWRLSFDGVGSPQRAFGGFADGPASAAFDKRMAHVTTDFCCRWVGPWVCAQQPAWLRATPTSLPHLEGSSVALPKFLSTDRVGAAQGTASGSRGKGEQRAAANPNCYMHPFCTLSPFFSSGISPTSSLLPRSQLRRALWFSRRTQTGVTQYSSTAVPPALVPPSCTPRREEEAPRYHKEQEMRVLLNMTSEFSYSTLRRAEGGDNGVVNDGGSGGEGGASVRRL